MGPQSEFITLKTRNGANDSHFRMSLNRHAMSEKHLRSYFANSQALEAADAMLQDFLFYFFFKRSHDRNWWTFSRNFTLHFSETVQDLATVTKLAPQGQKRGFSFLSFFHPPVLAPSLSHGRRFCRAGVTPLRQLTALIRESSTLTAKAVPQAKGWVRYSSVSGSSSSSWSRNWTLESLTGRGEGEVRDRLRKKNTEAEKKGRGPNFPLGKAKWLKIWREKANTDIMWFSF